MIKSEVEVDENIKNNSQRTVAITKEQLEEIKEDLKNRESNKENIDKEIFENPYFKRWYPTWVQSAVENYSQIKNDFAKRNCDLSSQVKANEPAIIIGGGPSFDDAVKYLKDWKHPILVSSSMAFNTVYEIDREPDFISAFDSLHKTAEHIGNYKWKNSTLVAHTTTEPKTLKKWKWNKLYYRRVFPGHPFFEYIMPMMFPMIKVGIRFTGNVINNGISVFDVLGYNPIFLVGVDLGWWDNKKPRASSFVQNKNGNIEYAQKPIISEDNPDIIKLDNGFKINSSMLPFKDSLLNIVMSDKNRKIYDCSNGLIEELPKVDIQKVVKTNGIDDYGFDFNIVKGKIKKYFDVYRINAHNKIKEALKQQQEKTK
jgi:hypothetical protein